MRKTLKNILIFSAVIILAALLITYFWNQQKDKFRGITSDNFSQIKPILPEEIFGSQGDNYKEFTSPDGKLKMKYPSDWLEITDEEMLREVIAQEWAEKYNLKTLFLVQKLKLGESSQIVINEGDFNIGFEEIIEEMKKSNLAKGWYMKIMNSNAEEGIFEASYQKPDHYELHSREKVLFDEQREGFTKTYLIAIVVFEKDWEASKNIVEEIIDSIQLIE